MFIIHRTISQDILDALERMPVVFVNGPRQAGKSTLVQVLAKKSWPAVYISFDEASQLGAAQANPESFLRGYTYEPQSALFDTDLFSALSGKRNLNKRALILDEVQRAPELFRALKIIVDELRLEHKSAANGRYLLTGSANIMALPGLAEALVGRMAIITLYPLSALEIVKGKGLFLGTLFENGFQAKKSKEIDQSLVEIMLRATFPEITDQDDRERHRWFESYITTILQRDVRQIANIEKLGALPNLLRILASRAGGLLNEADIARSVGLNAVTTKSYRLLLRMMFLNFDVRPWYRNIGKRLIKAPKIYLTDTSLLCHLLQINLRKTAAGDSHKFGQVLENFVASELLKQLAHFDQQVELLHFRTSDGKEVDFILQKPGGALAGIEVKAKDNVGNDDFKGLREFQDQIGKDFACGVVLYRGNSLIPFGDKLWAVPVNALWA